MSNVPDGSCVRKTSPMDNRQVEDKILPLPHLMRYAAFLLEDYFDELVAEDLKRNKAEKLPLLKFFKHFSEKELLEFAAQRFRQFLQILCSPDPYQQTDHLLEAWKANKVHGLPKEIVVASDLVKGYTNRKKTLLSFLPSFTQDIHQAIAVVNELEDYFAYLASGSFRIFLEVQKTKENEMLRAMEIACIGSYTWDLEQDIIIFSPQLYKIYDLEEKEKISFSTILNLVHPDDQEHFVQSVNESVDQKWPLDVEYRIIRKNNEERIVWGKGELIYHNGKAVKMQGTVLDVTERRLTEIEVQYREAQLVEAQSIAQIGSFDWDFVNNRSTCTAELYRIFGWPSDRELNFSTFEELSHPDDLEKVFLSLHNAMENKAPYDCEYRILTANKTQKWVWARGKVTFDQNGNGIRLTGTVLDITERKMAEEEIRNKNRAIRAAYQKLEHAQEELKAINHQLEDRVKERTHDLEQSILNQQKSARELKKKNIQLENTNADLDNFIYTASHDLKAPITNIEGLVNLLKDFENTGNPKFPMIIDMINTSILRFKETIKDLTEISKVQKDNLEDIECLKLEEVLDDALFDIKELLNKNVASVETDFSIKELRFSRKNLRSLLYNLVSNAIKYQSPQREPRVVIKCHKEQEYVILTVEDNGLGIPENKTDKIPCSSACTHMLRVQG